jgi:1A family penicillin-binding protein
MLNAEHSKFDKHPRDPKRRSSLHKVVAVDPKYVGLASARHHASRVHQWIIALGGLLGASFLTAFLVLVVSAAFGVYTVVSSFAASLPPPSQLSSIRVDQSTKIYDRYGNLLYEVLDPSSGKRTVIPFDQIPLVMKQATIATEDPTFYINPGVDPAGIARAFYYTFIKGDLTGGSTITQQLVKNNLLTSEVSLDRKLRELILSVEVSQKYSKDEILGAYLNTINYGNLSYGVEAAAQSYFDKDAKDLDLAEASLLAGLPQKPAEYDPCLNPDAALARQQDVLRLMQQNGYIKSDQIGPASQEMTERLHSDAFKQHCDAKVGTVAPHFVAYVREQLEKIYGPDVTDKGGLQVYTTLDPQIQKIAEDEAQKQIAQLKAQHVTNAAVVVLKPDTGEILAMVGSVNYFDKSIDGEVNVATQPRQPGSSIKPINYVSAFRKGWNPETTILDAPVSFSTSKGQPPYTPKNYDLRWHGVVTVRQALANSLNVPAVKTLYFVGVPAMLDMAQQFGYTTFEGPSHYGLALTLGAGEVTLLQHTGAYAVFANYGKRVPPTPFLKILDGSGQVLLDLEKNKPAGQQIVDPGYAYEITSILEDNHARIPEFGPYSPLHLCANGTSVCHKSGERPVAAKTGTTTDFRDNWTMGYTPELAVGVWVGNSDNSQMVNSTGITGAAPIWHNVMARIYAQVAPYKNIAPHDFAVPSDMVRARVRGVEEWLLPPQLAFINMPTFGVACSMGYGGLGAPGLSITATVSNPDVPACGQPSSVQSPREHNGPPPPRHKKKP